MGLFRPPPPRKLRHAAAKPLTAAQLLERDIERGFRCGARYSAARWRRRAPPRLRLLGPGAAGYGTQLLAAQAFYRGYDAATRARFAHDRAWAEPWLDPEGLQSAA